MSFPHTDCFLFQDGNIEFPNDYPIGCLLGSVDVVDCLAQEEYIKKVCIQSQHLCCIQKMYAYNPTSSFHHFFM